MSTVLIALLAIVSSLIVYAILWARKVNRKWKERGLPYVEPTLFLGNNANVVLLRKSQGEQMKAISDSLPNEGVIGFYDFTVPRIMVVDASVAERILIKDFNHFVDRGFPVNEEINPLDVSLFNMTGKRWKAVRNKLSPIFTTGKLRNMFEQMFAIGKNVDTALEKEDLKGIEMLNIFSRYVIDVIGSYAFGLDAGNLLKKDSEFYKMNKKVFTVSPFQFLKFLLLVNFPNLMLKFGVSFTKTDVRDYFCNIIKETVRHRTENNLKRSDFIDLMLQLKEKGHVQIQTLDPSDDYLNIDTESYVTESFEVTDNLLVGQAFIFLVAGSDVASNALNFCCYEMCKNPEIQEKLRQEVMEKVNRQGKLNFDAIREMTYLEMCLKETMRKYPPLPNVMRICTKEYTLPSGIVIKPGETVIVPMFSIHHNPTYYPDPMKFDPERFGPDATIRPCTWIPFGEGPRVCIAMRFVLHEMKFVLAKMFMDYKFTLNPKTTEPLVYNKIQFFTSIKNPIYFNLEKIPN